MVNSPHLHKPVSVRLVMGKVLLALVPGIAIYVWFFGAAILVQIALASAAALAGEAAMLKARGKPLELYLGDGSALVTAWLIALAFPPIVPWWLTVSATLFAIIIAKHLFGGLGQNPFNPAMVAFAVCIIAFPALMAKWPAAGFTDFGAQMAIVFGGQAPLDAVTLATPLDSLRTHLSLPEAHATVASVAGSDPGFGRFGGKGWEWVGLGWLLGGLWLLQQRVFTWHVPLAFLAVLALIAGGFSLAQPERFAGPLYHLASGGTLLASFFILTDPVSGATTPRGKLIFAAGAALLVWIIRTFGAYPDGIAFAVLLMNLSVPLIDMGTQPPVFGHKRKGGAP
ncbi:MAG TPA: RnfABCDGE type electron transport complex subunit D [Candidatus Desulfobacillus sp.]|nr:RnfABCDGE type electron transport complex subunit D [Candidatus Desulfobacillus sp.]